MYDLVEVYTILHARINFVGQHFVLSTKLERQVSCNHVRQRTHCVSLGLRTVRYGLMPDLHNCMLRCCRASASAFSSTAGPRVAAFIRWCVTYGQHTQFSAWSINSKVYAALECRGVGTLSNERPWRGDDELFHQQVQYTSYDRAKFSHRPSDHHA